MRKLLMQECLRGFEDFEVSANRENVIEEADNSRRYSSKQCGITTVMLENLFWPRTGV